MLSPRRIVALIAAATMLGGAGAASARPRRFHRHERNAEGEVTNHYSDRGAKPAKVALPQMTVRSRSLLGKDGVTTVEISTAPFDTGATPLGNISRVRIDAVDANGGVDRKLNFHKEYEHLNQGGYLSFKYNVLPHLQGLRISVRGRGAVHGQELEGVLSDKVYFRPDLAVSDMAVPATATPNTVVFMTATVVERRGDVGGTADCVTLIDGAQVDLNPNVWVAANGLVTCSMAAAFSAGKHTVTMRVQNVRPGDYDDSNNEMSASIDVRQPVAVSYFAEASENTTDVVQAQDCYMTSSSTTPEKHTATDNTQTAQSRVVNGSVPLALNVPFSVSFSDGSGGKTLSTMSIDKPVLQVVPVDDPASWTDQSSYSQDDGNGTVVTITRYANSNLNTGSTTVSFQMNATEANYHSEQWCKSSPSFQCAGGDFSTASDTPSGSGPVVQLASDYTVDLSLNDGTAYSAHAQAQLVTVNDPPQVSGSCFNRVFTGTDGTVGKMCNTTTVTTSSKDGSVSQ